METARSGAVFFCVHIQVEVEVENKSEMQWGVEPPHPRLGPPVIDTTQPRHPYTKL